MPKAAIKESNQLHPKTSLVIQKTNPPVLRMPVKKKILEISQLITIMATKTIAKATKKRKNTSRNITGGLIEAIADSIASLMEEQNAVRVYYISNPIVSEMPV